MRFLPASLTPLALAALLIEPHQAEACGGCFHPPTRSTQVTGHRMIFAVSPERTTLFDQIEYSGAPEDFAWVLPIRGQVEVGLSSDLLFANLESLTSVQIVAPALGCPICDDFNATAAGPGPGPGPGPTGGGVEVIASEVVGPYDTVQLSSDDPGALLDWLQTNGYVVDASVLPVLDAYVDEGFDFLALRLAPGQGVQSMQPVRVTSPGAGFELPLRMVAAGTGASTAISLWVVSEGRYQPANFPVERVSESDLVWDWSQNRSNYSMLREEIFQASDGFAWIVDSASPITPGELHLPLQLALEIPLEETGYASVDDAIADYDILTADFTGSPWVTLLSAELSRPALEEDLRLEAAPNQSPVSRTLLAADSINAPPCPDCGGEAGSTSTTSGEGGTGGASPGGSGCSTAPAPSSAVWLTTLLAAALGLARRSRRP
jgi:MYXO-CTERM domain-containing protein